MPTMMPVVTQNPDAIMLLSYFFMLSKQDRATLLKLVRHVGFGGDRAMVGLFWETCVVHYAIGPDVEAGIVDVTGQECEGYGEAAGWGVKEL